RVDLVVAAAEQAAEPQRRGEQRAGFAAVDTFQRFLGRSGPLALGFEVFHLAADHAGRTDRGADELDGAAARFGRRARRLASQQRQPERQQGVAGEDRRRLVVLLVQRGATAAQVIVVERRQVVV